jgi:hypothetical protein
VVSGRVLDNKTLIAINSLVLDRLLNSPLADVCPFLLGARCVLLRMRGFPALVPVVGKLLKEISLEVSRLCGEALAINQPYHELMES